MVLGWREGRGVAVRVGLYRAMRPGQALWLLPSEPGSHCRIWSRGGACLPCVFRDCCCSVLSGLICSRGSIPSHKLSSPREPTNPNLHSFHNVPWMPIGGSAWGQGGRRTCPSFGKRQDALPSCIHKEYRSASGVLGLVSTLPVFCYVILGKQVTLFEPVFLSGKSRL